MAADTSTAIQMDWLQRASERGSELDDADDDRDDAVVLQSRLPQTSPSPSSPRPPSRLPRTPPLSRSSFGSFGNSGSLRGSFGSFGALFGQARVDPWNGSAPRAADGGGGAFTTPLPPPPPPQQQHHPQEAQQPRSSSAPRLLSSIPRSWTLSSIPRRSRTLSTLSTEDGPQRMTPSTLGRSHPTFKLAGEEVAKNKWALAAQASLLPTGRSPASDMRRTGWVLDPRQMPMLAQWDMLMVFALVLTALITPVEVSFLMGAGEHINALWVFNRVLDLLFFTDLVISFHLAYQERVENGGHWVVNQRVIISQYLRSWFFIDLLSILPFWLMILDFEDPFGTSASASSELSAGMPGGALPGASAAHGSAPSGGRTSRPSRGSSSLRACSS